MRFFHQGQLEGKKVKIPVHLVRGPIEIPDHVIVNFYAALLECLKDEVFKEGEWQLLDCRAAWEGNWTSDCFIAFGWTLGDQHRLIVVNDSDHQSQCYVSVPWPDLTGRQIHLQDQMSDAVYDRDGIDRGLYLDMAAWSYHVFTLS